MFKIDSSRFARIDGKINYRRRKDSSMAREMWTIRIDIRYYDGPDTHALPAGATLRAVGVQERDVITCWYEVPDIGSEERHDHTLLIVGTGHRVPDGYVYRGTTMHQDGTLILHVFERVG